MTVVTSELSIGAQKRHARAIEYRRLAGLEQAAAAASPLDEVREKHRRSAARWLALAELDEQSA